MKAIEALTNEQKKGKITHAYLFIGGTEKDLDLIVNFFIKTLRCKKEDLSIIESNEAVGKTGEVKIDEIRALLHDVNLSPSGNCRIAIIKNAERLNQSSGNILLKTLEEPPSFLTFLLFSARSQILPTIKSRCRVFDLNKNEEQIQPENFEQLWGKNFFEASTKIDKIIKEERLLEYISDIENYLRSEMLDKKDEKLAIILENYLNEIKKIENNANPRLVLECVYLKLKESL